MATKIKTRKKREKHVFPGNELAHVWASQSQNDGRTPTGTFYFNGDTIYSYGSHFPIATFHKMPCGKRVVLLNSRDYSMSTGGHKYCVESALRGLEIEIVRMPDKVWFCFESGKQHLLSLINKYFDLSSRAREYAMSHRKVAFDYIADLKRWGELHRRKAIYKLTKEDKEIILRADEQNINKAKREAAREKIAEFQRLAAMRLLKEVCGGDISAYWRLHGQLPPGYNMYKYLPDTVCRIVDDEIVTSRGARVPIRHAKRLFPFIYACKENNTSYEADTKRPFRIGYYTLHRIEANGDIQIGCHHIKYEEIELLGRELMPELFGETKKEGV